MVDIRVRLPDGTRYRERAKDPVQSKSGAKRWGEERERFLALHGLQQPKKEAPTVREFAPRWLDDYVRANKLKPSTVNTYENIRLKLHILPALGALRLSEVDDAALQRLKGRMVELDPKTVNDVLGVLSKLLKTAIEWKDIDVMPCVIKPLKRDMHQAPRFHDFDEYEQLVEGAKNAGADVFAFLLLGGEAGLRRGEIVAVEWPDVDFKRNQITVARADWEGTIGAPKGGRTRRVPMTTRLAEALQAIRHLRNRRVLIQADGCPVTKDTLRSWMQRAAKLAGMAETFDIHILRHTFCSHLAMRGAPARAIMELAGHSDLTTTMRYMHLSSASVNGAIKLLEQRGAPGAPEGNSSSGEVKT